MNMKELIIYGTGINAEIADFYFFHDAGRRAIAFTTHEQFKDRDEFLGRPVIAFEVLLEKFSPASHEVFTAIGYSEVNGVRQKRVRDVRSAGFDLTSYVSSKATFWDGFNCRENCFILEHSNIQPFAKIGRNVTMWSATSIGHHSIVEDDCFFAIGVTVSGLVTVGQSSFVGANVTIRDGVRIGKRCVIGAGAVVLEDIPADSIVGGAGSPIWSIPSSQLRRI